jgi:hypothetical protein
MYTFVNGVDARRFECVVCLEVMVKGTELPCCGVQACRHCFLDLPRSAREGAVESEKDCPKCRHPFDIFKPASFPPVLFSLNAAIADLAVQCTRCMHTGPLRDLKRHECMGECRLL